MQSAWVSSFDSYGGESLTPEVYLECLRDEVCMMDAEGELTPEVRAITRKLLPLVLRLIENPASASAIERYEDADEKFAELRQKRFSHIIDSLDEDDIDDEEGSHVDLGLYPEWVWAFRNASPDEHDSLIAERQKEWEARKAISEDDPLHIFKAMDMDHARRAFDETVELVQDFRNDPDELREFFESRDLIAEESSEGENAEIEQAIKQNELIASRYEAACRTFIRDYTSK